MRPGTRRTGLWIWLFVLALLALIVIVAVRNIQPRLPGMPMTGGMGQSVERGAGGSMPGMDMNGGDGVPVATPARP